MSKDSEFDKKYYRMGEAVELIGVPASTLRFWETCFPRLHPRRNAGGTRYYTPEDIELLRRIRFLVHEKGLRIDVARRQLDYGEDEVGRRVEALARLREVRHELKGLLDVLEQRRY